MYLDSFTLDWPEIEMMDTVMVSMPHIWKLISTYRMWHYSNISPYSMHTHKLILQNSLCQLCSKSEVMKFKNNYVSIIFFFIYLQAMKILSKKRLIKKAGFYRKQPLKVYYFMNICFMLNRQMELEEENFSALGFPYLFFFFIVKMKIYW